jgi:hypothetical protein
MSTEQPRRPIDNSTPGSATQLRRLTTRTIARAQCEGPEPRPKEWRDHLRNLQEWVCELLIKNRELRMALEKEKHHGESNEIAFDAFSARTDRCAFDPSQFRSATNSRRSLARRPLLREPTDWKEIHPYTDT